MASTLRPWLEDVIALEIASLLQWARHQNQSVSIKPDPDRTTRYSAHGSTLKSELSSTSLRIDCPVQLVRVLSEKRPVTFLVSDSRFQLHLQLTEDAVARFEREIDADVTSDLKGDIILLRRFSVGLTNIGPSASRIQVNALDLDYVTTQRKIVGQPVPLTESTRIGQLVHQYKDRLKSQSHDATSRASPSSAIRRPSAAPKRSSGSPDRIIASQLVPQPPGHTHDPHITSDAHEVHNGHQSRAAPDSSLRKRKRASSTADDVQMQSGVNLAQPHQANPAGSTTRVSLAAHHAAASTHGADFLQLLNKLAPLPAHLPQARKPSQEARPPFTNDRHLSSMAYIPQPSVHAAMLAQQQQRQLQQTMLNQQQARAWEQQHSHGQQQQQFPYQDSRHSNSLAPPYMATTPLFTESRHSLSNSYVQALPAHYLQSAAATFHGQPLRSNDLQHAQPPDSHLVATRVPVVQRIVTEVMESPVSPKKAAGPSSSNSNDDSRHSTLQQLESAARSPKPDTWPLSEAQHGGRPSKDMSLNHAALILDPTSRTSTPPDPDAHQPKRTPDADRQAVDGAMQHVATVDKNHDETSHSARPVAASPASITANLSIRPTSQTSTLPPQAISVGGDSEDEKEICEVQNGAKELHDAHSTSAAQPLLQPLGANSSTYSTDDARLGCDQQPLQPPAKMLRDPLPHQVKTEVPARRSISKKTAVEHSARDYAGESRRYIIPDDQAVLLEKPSSWVPPPIGQEHPVPNVPISLLNLWNKSQLESLTRTRSGSPPDHHSLTTKTEDHAAANNSYSVDEQLTADSVDPMQGIEIRDDDVRDKDYVDDGKDDSEEDDDDDSGSDDGSDVRAAARERFAMQQKTALPEDDPEESSGTSSSPPSPSPSLDRDLPEDSDIGDEIVVSTERYRPLYAKQAASARASADIEEAVPQAFPTQRQNLNTQHSYRSPRKASPRKGSPRKATPQKASPRKASPQKPTPRQEHEHKASASINSLQKLKNRGPSEEPEELPSAHTTSRSPPMLPPSSRQADVRMTQKSATTLLSLINRDVGIASSPGRTSPSPIMTRQASQTSQPVQSTAGATSIGADMARWPADSQQITLSLSHAGAQHDLATSLAAQDVSVQSAVTQDNTNINPPSSQSQIQVSTPTRLTRRTLPDSFGTHSTNRSGQHRSVHTSGFRPGSTLKDAIPSSPLKRRRHTAPRKEEKSGQSADQSFALSSEQVSATKARNQRQTEHDANGTPSQVDSTTRSAKLSHTLSTNPPELDSSSTKNHQAEALAKPEDRTSAPASIPAQDARRPSTPIVVRPPDVVVAATPTKLQEFAVNWMDIGPGGAFAQEDVPDSRPGWRLSVLSWSL